MAYAYGQAYGPAYSGYGAGDPRSSPYGQVAADPYAAQAYDRQMAGSMTQARATPTPGSGYASQAAGYQQPAAGYPSTASAYGYPAGYPAAGGAPGSYPQMDPYSAHYQAAQYAAYSAGYGAAPMYGMPSYGMMPVYPGYAPAPPGYGPMPTGYGPPSGSSRHPSPRRDGRGRDQKGGGNRGGRPMDRQNNDDVRRRPNDPKSRVQHLLKNHPRWMAVWLEGIDPPRRLASRPNVTMLMLTNTDFKKGAKEELGFVLAASRLAAKKKERERECTKELIAALDQLPLSDAKAWCHLPEPGAIKNAVEPADLSRLTTLVCERCPNTTVEMPMPTACVLVAVTLFGSEGVHGTDPELEVLDKFDSGFSELLREARRVEGLVRKQWFLAVVWAKPEARENENRRPFLLGVGLATDIHLARARAVFAAEHRTAILTDAMFVGPAAPKVVQMKPPPAASDTAPGTSS